MVLQAETTNAPVDRVGTRPTASESAGGEGAYFYVVWGNDFRPGALLLTSPTTSACVSLGPRDVIRVDASARREFTEEAVASLAFEGVMVPPERADRWLEEVLEEPPLDVSALGED